MDKEAHSCASLFCVTGSCKLFYLTIDSLEIIAFSGGEMLPKILDNTGIICYYFFGIVDKNKPY